MTFKQIVLCKMVKNKNGPSRTQSKLKNSKAHHITILCLIFSRRDILGRTLHLIYLTLNVPAAVHS